MASRAGNAQSGSTFRDGAASCSRAIAVHMSNSNTRLGRPRRISEQSTARGMARSSRSSRLSSRSRGQLCLTFSSPVRRTSLCRLRSSQYLLLPQRYVEHPSQFPMIIRRSPPVHRQSCPFGIHVALDGEVQRLACGSVHFELVHHAGAHCGLRVFEHR